MDRRVALLAVSIGGTLAGCAWPPSSPESAFSASKSVLANRVQARSAFTRASGATEFAFVANWGSADVSAYSVGTNGALTPVPGSPFAAGSEPAAITVDPGDKFAYIANSNASSISAYSIDSTTGALTT